MPFGIDFWTNFGRLGLPKWSQVGTKIGSKIDVNFEWRFFKNHQFQTKNEGFCNPAGRSWESKTSKNRSENEVENGLHLGFDF